MYYNGNVKGLTMCALFLCMYLQSVVFNDVYHVWNIDGRHNDL